MYVPAAFVETGLLAVTPPTSQQLMTVDLSLASTATGGLLHFVPTPLNATYYDSRHPPEVSALAPLAGPLVAPLAFERTAALLRTSPPPP